MKAALCLFTLCLAGYASSSQYAWQTGKEYSYDVQARVFSGVDIATQYAGLQIQYNVKVTATGPNTLHFNPNNFRAVELNSQLNGGWRDAELQNETPAEIKRELLKYLESNIVVTMEKGTVQSIQVEDNLPTWAVNMKKAQVSHFNLDTTGANSVVSGNLNRQTNSVRPEEANQESGYFYETMEETVHGECETYYTISQNGPFDWPYQFQQQAQPGQQNDQDQSQEGNQNNNQKNSQNQNGSNESNQSDDNNSSQQQDQEQNSSEEKRQQNNRQKFAFYRQLAQQQDSGSAEDSHETNQGELPWPKAFATFCQEQDQVYEIIKTVNFTSCKNKPVLAYSTNAGLHGRAGDNTIGAALARSLVTRYLACGKDRQQYTILKVEQEEQLNYGLRLEQNTVAGAVQNITLRSVQNAQRVEPIAHPKTIEDLTYTFDPKEQQLQREGKLQHAYFDVMEDNENNDSNSSEEQYERSTTYSPNQYNNGNDQDNQYSQENQQHRQRKQQRQHRHPRSASNEQGSQESSQNYNSQESQENSNENKNNNRAYRTDAEGRNFLRKPSLEYPPINPLLVSPLQASGMQSRVEVLMTEITKDILDNSQPMAEAETLSKISTVARIIRYLNAAQIQALYHKLASKTQTEEDQTCRNVFLDAVSIAGTNPAIYTLIELIKNNDITGEQANQLVMTFPMYIRTPTQALFRHFFTLVESPAAEKCVQLKTTALLAFSNTLYQSYVNLRIKNSRYPVAQYGEFGNQKDVQEQYVQYFQKNLQEALEKEQSEGNNKHFTITYLTAFGNLGVEQILPQVQRILDDSTDVYIKTKAILALHRVIVSRSTQNIPTNEIHGVDRNGQDSLTDEVVEKQVMPVLVSAAFDKGEHPEVRMAAFSLLMYTTAADVAIWQQMAYSTWFEPSKEVHSFVYSSLKSLAYLNQDVPSIHWQMQKNARAVLALAKPIAQGYAKSRNSFAAGIAEHLQTNYIHQTQYFGSKDSNVPNFMYYKNLVQYGNRAITTSPFQFQIYGHTMQKLASFAFAQFKKSQNQNQQNDQEAHKDIEQIYQILGISRREQEEDIEGSFDIKIRDEMQRLWSVNEEKIEEYYKAAGQQGLQKLFNGIPINYQKTIHAAENVFEMPCILGVPVTFNSRMPVHVSLRGNVRLVQEGQDFQLQVELHPVYAIKTHARLSFKVPFTGKKYQAGVQRHFVAEVPFRALVRRAPSGQVVVAVSPSQLTKGVPSGPIPVATFHQKPYTAIITDSLWPTSHKEGGQMTIVHVTQEGQEQDQGQGQNQNQNRDQSQKQFKRQSNFGQRSFGFNFQSEEISEYSQQAERSSGWIKFWQRFHSPSCFFQLGWLGGQNVRYAERSLSLDVANSETKTIVFVVAGKRQQAASAKDLWQDSSSASSQSTEESASSEQSKDSSSQQQDSNEQQDNQSSRKQRRHGSDSDSGASHSAEDMNQGGYIVAAAVIGKRTPIRPVQDGKASIQKILQKGSPSTIQYFAQFSKSNGRVYFRAASGDAANEAAKALPQSSKSLQALREALVESPNTKAQPDGCAEFEGEYDPPAWANRGQQLVLRKRLLADELVVKIKAELQFGESCQKMPYEIKLQGKLERDQQMTEYAKHQSRQAQKCSEDEKKGFNVSPVCIEVAEQQAAALNKGDLKFTFTQMPRQFLNRSDDFEDFAKALLYPYVSTDRFHEGAGEKKLRVEFFLTPNKQFLDVHITKPHSKLSFQSIRTNRAIQNALPFTATQSWANNVRDRAFRADSNPSCSIQGNYVNTFDNVTYRFSDQAGQNCYHVVAQDASGKHPVAILVRDIATDQKKTVIYLGAKTKIELTPQEQNQHSSQFRNAKLRVDINDQRVESLPRVIRGRQSGQVIARIEQDNQGGIQVFSQYFDVTTNAKYVVVYASNPLRNRTAGVCGDFNGEKVADMKSPQNCPLSSGSLLVASYAMKPQQIDSSEKGQCKVSSQLKKQLQQEGQQCQSNSAYYPNNPRRYSYQDHSGRSAFYDESHNHGSNNGNQNGNGNNGNGNGNNNGNQLQGVGSDCIDTISSAIRKVVYNVVNTVLKPFVWFPSTRHGYANKVADAVVNKIAGFLKEGSAEKIAEAIATGVCDAVGLLPVVGTVAKAACKLAKSLLVKGLLLAVNPICKKTGCCTPTSKALYAAEYEQALNFAFPEEIEADEDNSVYPYLNAAESRLSCDEKIERFLSRAAGHIAHALLQGEQHMSENRRQRIAHKVQKEVQKSLKKALKEGGNLPQAVIDAVQRAQHSERSEARLNHSIFQVASKVILNKMCQEQQCCKQGQY
jgi:hypothetical protein